MFQESKSGTEKALRAFELSLFSYLVLGGTLPTVDPIEAAKARHTWTWFGLDEAQANAEAQRSKVTMVVAERDGKHGEFARPQSHVVMVVIHQGLVTHAVGVNVKKEPFQEGVRDLALLPWLGLTEQAATKQAIAAGRVVRVMARDGESFVGTADFNEQRLNLFLRGGVVVAITSG